MQVPDVPPSEEIRFRVRLRTRWSDDDAQQVLNNAVFLTLFEEGRHAYFSELGLLEGRNFPFLLSMTQLRFLHPGSGGREVTVELGTVRLGRSALEQVYRVADGESGETWCEGVAILVCFDPRTGASAPMTAGFRSAVARFEGLD